MTDKQTIKRLWVRHDFMEAWLARLLMVHQRIDRVAAISQVRVRCESALRRKGYKYPEDERAR